MKRPEALPDDIAAALTKDGAIRLVDGRWSGGFVNTDRLKALVESGQLATRKRQGFSFAILPR